MFRPEIHFEPEQILIRALVVVVPKQATEVGTADMALTSDLL
jgi:hypothetical protein